MISYFLLNPIGSMPLSCHLHQEAGVTASKWTMTPRRERRGALGAGSAVGGPGEPGPGDYDLEVWLGEDQPEES